MLFGQDRNALRQQYLSAWQKHQQGQPLEPLEKMIAQTITEHPEYHTLLTKTEQALSQDFDPETGNPFMHMGLHIAIQEQLSTDRPPGIRTLYQQLLAHYQDAHTCEHQMMQALSETLWQSQQSGSEPDSHFYLNCLQKLLNR